MWVLATRSRPANCARFINAWKETQASTPVYVRLDQCDPNLEELTSLDWPKEFTINIGPREGCRAAYTEAYNLHGNESWYGMLADDLVPKTPHWDRLLIEQAGTKSISYPNDLGGKPRLPTHPVIAGDLVRAVGWFGFPLVQHLFVDTAWKVIGERLGCLHRMPEVIVEHMHPAWNKADGDLVYKESVQRSAGDREKFNQWVEFTVPNLIERLKEQGF